MSVKDLLSKTVALAAKRADDVETKYRALVRQCAIGRPEVSPEKVVAHLAEWGRDAVQFQADVETDVKRLEWAEVARHLPQHRADLAAVEQAIRDVDTAYTAALENARRDTLEKLSPLQSREAQLKASIKAAERAAAELQTTAPPEVQAQEQEIEQRLRDARRALGQLGDEGHKNRLDGIDLGAKVQAGLGEYAQRLSAQERAVGATADPTDYRTRLRENITRGEELSRQVAAAEADVRRIEAELATFQATQKLAP